MENEERKMKDKEYNHKYYLKTREKRRSKVKCDVCGRYVCSEYMYKHKQKRICLKHKKENLVNS
mgnify:FL=1